jgi:tetratricopeptide (TPR) repeat protein
VAASAPESGDVTVRALKLYEKHRYADAARLLQSEISATETEKQSSVNLALGMTYLGSGKMYRDLQKTALVIEQDYLTQLAKQKTSVPSRYVDYYLGLVLLEAGKPNEALTYLRKFAQTANVEMKPFAAIGLGVAYSGQKQMQKANQEWARLDSAKPEIQAALAATYALIRAQEKKAVAMADAAMSDGKLQGTKPSNRMLAHVLRAYSLGGAPEKALALLNSNEFKDVSYVEEVSTSKSISFYDVSVLGDVAKTHLQMARLYLERAARDPKLSGAASYYLADAYLQLGNAEMSLKTVAMFLAQAKVPAQLKGVALVNQASAHSLAGKTAEANVILLSMAEKSGDDFALMAEIMQSCTKYFADCSKIQQLALLAHEKGEGKKIFSLSAALGKYYFMQKDYVQAEFYMEAGRDKAHKNKIEENDPLLLVELAEAYYRNKKFSENLEIYFELGKHYPAVRQIQEAMQGIYSMEQQSAGDVKIF